MSSKVSLHPRGYRKEWLPSKKSIAPVWNSSYVDSNTGHVFGELLHNLKVRPCTNSYTLSNKPLAVIGGKAATYATCISHIPRTLFSRVFLMIGTTTSWTCARISGKELTDETICRTVSIHLTWFLSITHRAEGLCDTRRHVGLIILTISTCRCFQAIAPGCALFICDHLTQQAAVWPALSVVRNRHSSRGGWHTQDVL
jgi:hypothetical protein